MSERVTDVIALQARVRPDQMAVADGPLVLTWDELARAVATTAGKLLGQGLLVGDRVAVCVSDGAPGLIVALAVLHAGGVHVPVDHSLAGAEVENLITVLRTPWQVTLPPRITLAELAHLELKSTGHAREADPLGTGRSAFLRMSSGTTGAAKGVLLGHDTIIRRIEAANRGLGLTASDRVLWLLPMAYHFAVSILLYLRVGAAIIFGNALRASSTSAIARDRMATVIYASPYHVRRLADLAAGNDLPGSLRMAISTTTALDSDASRDFHARHRLGVRQGLGIIEVGLPFLSPGLIGEQPGELGAPLPDYQVAILAEDGEPVPADGPGELAIAGPGMLDAYLQPWRRREEILVRGFFRTGDRARRDQHGGVCLLGRIKDVINVGGVKVFPLEVECVLDAHPQVLASRVRAAPEPRLGEQVHADIQVRPGCDPDSLLVELPSWCTERLAPLKRPSSYAIVEAIAMTPSGKVRR